MFYSKSFGYALRGVLYIALICKDNQRIQVDEIARELNVPKHFLSKILKKIVKNGILNSTKGPYGGFSINEKTVSTFLYDLFVIINGETHFDNCVLGLNKCNPDQPCPLHDKMQPSREEVYLLFTRTTIGNLLEKEQTDLIRGISLKEIKDKN